MAPNGSQWLAMARNDFHRVSLLPYHYPKFVCGRLHLEFPRNAPPELVLDWSGANIGYIGKVSEGGGARGLGVRGG